MTGFRVFVYFVLALVLPCLPAWAEAPVLGLPISCELGTDCWPVNFVDLDTGPGVRDFRCQKHSYDGHKGIDIAIQDLSVMRRDVPVIAAAEGTIKGIRDGMEDIDITVRGLNSVKNRECGNGVVIDHGEGWVTQYCHMRQNSVVVKKGNRVQKGQTLGMTGISGTTQFPHVHLSVRHNDKIVDPFIGLGPGSNNCDVTKNTLWQPDLIPALLAGPTALYSAGFAAKPPKATAIRGGLHNDKVLGRASPALIFWLDTFWLSKGDVLEIKIQDPAGGILVQKSFQIQKTSARRNFYIGSKKKTLFWKQGIWRATAIIKRKNAPHATEPIAISRAVEIR